MLPNIWFDFLIRNTSCLQNWKSWQISFNISHFTNVVHLPFNRRRLFGNSICDIFQLYFHHSVNSIFWRMLRCIHHGNIQGSFVPDLLCWSRYPSSSKNNYGVPFKYPGPENGGFSMDGIGFRWNKIFKFEL